MRYIFPVSIVDEKVTLENQSLKQNITDKEDERERLERLVVQLSEVKYYIYFFKEDKVNKRQREEREFLQAKQQMMEEYIDLCSINSQTSFVCFFSGPKGVP